MGGAEEKKAKVAERGQEGGSPKASSQLLDSIEKLQVIQDELEAINEKASYEVLEVEKKFNELRKPVFAKRNEVIVSIQDFWLTAFLSHPVLGDILSKEDKEILKHMVSLELEEAKDVKSGYSITLNFSPNPYFEDKKLTKTYCYDEEGNLSIRCEPIKWKEGKGITDGDRHEKGAKRPYTSESFFTWFSEVVWSDGRVDEIAEIIRDDLWPNPLKHLQNEVDATGLYGEGEGEEVTGESNVGINEDEDEEEEEVVDDDDKEYREEDGDDEEEIDYEGTDADADEED
ncbi:NAP1-related protein 2-like isoform X5 [Carex littledalei]|uniref:NAP1-related protein 2-like isoform X5 n=1 Tax=Carex littledalei TaxID=544730 RepID=A0A833QMI5_9POAL|nr:NAP1-related protein 2-like isoform X5 [Carex littledalei]